MRAWLLRARVHVELAPPRKASATAWPFHSWPSGRCRPQCTVTCCSLCIPLTEAAHARACYMTCSALTGKTSTHKNVLYIAHSTHKGNSCTCSSNSQTRTYHSVMQRAAMWPALLVPRSPAFLSACASARQIPQANPQSVCVLSAQARKNTCKTHMFKPHAHATGLHGAPHPVHTARAIRPAAGVPVGSTVAPAGASPQHEVQSARMTC